MQTSLTCPAAAPRLPVQQHRPRRPQRRHRVPCPSRYRCCLSRPRLPCATRAARGRAEAEAAGPRARRPLQAVMALIRPQERLLRMPALSLKLALGLRLALLTHRLVRWQDLRRSHAWVTASLSAARTGGGSLASCASSASPHSPLASGWALSSTSVTARTMALCVADAISSVRRTTACSFAPVPSPSRRAWRIWATAARTSSPRRAKASGSAWPRRHPRRGRWAERRLRPCRSLQRRGGWRRRRVLR
mmetsp:Transcript_5966/g.15211  ORF Transcript_5966/g.15211 Transcript_5966/m.15211 type:complete len:248 (+) Transcript_5966:413-1156(+)